MKARYFYTLFIEEMKEDSIDQQTGKSYFELYKDLPSFTKLVNYNVIHRIIENSPDELTVQHEYFRIDTVGWKSRYKSIEKQAFDLGFNPHLWDLKVAVEHENSTADWNDEVIKLVHIKCPLKVIIGYNNSDLRGEVELEKLNFLSQCMNCVDAFHSGKEEFLVILGNATNSKTKETDYKKFGYKGYLYNYGSMRFEELD